MNGVPGALLPGSDGAFAAAAACAAVAAGAAAGALGRRLRRRRTLKAVLPGRAPQTDRSGARSRRRRLDDTLRQIAETKRLEARRQGRTTLSSRIRQSGLAWSRTTYLLVSAGVGGLAAILALGPAGLPAPAAASLGLAAAGLLPHLYVARRRKRRLAAFSNELPDALDVIVRSVKAGLPLRDSVKAVASDGREPVRSEFRALVADMSLGLSLDDAVARMARRMPTLEAKLLGIILSIQNRSGGSLSGALENLSVVLRDRKRMKMKIQSLSSEATASAAIVGALPVFVAGALHLFAPDYLTLLFTTGMGKLCLAASAVWMTVGVLVMRKMINFDF